jgi:glycerol-3-phosphate dehydrogenase
MVGIESADEQVDLLIIGGGINGSGIARDAVGRGLRVALVEQSDLASATSSAATKLIHGGLRYLEFFEFRLVREALIERERLLAIAPHIIRPLEFVWPHVATLRPRWQIRLGLFLYDHLGGRQRLPGSRGIRIAGTHYGTALRESIRRGFTYADCWADDSRLVILNALDAAERGAKIHTRTRFIRAQGAREHWLAECEHLLTGRRFTIKARAIVNAAGPWVERALAHIAGLAPSSSQVRLVKGSHIVVPKLYEGEHAYTLQNADGRVIFTIPYEERYTVVGTTDVAYDGDPAQVRITDDEIRYLCEAANRYLRRPIAPSDVQWTYSGVRPLVDDEAASVSKVTRDYRLELTRSTDGLPLLAIFGGKITTYRKLAEAALEKLHPFIGPAAHGRGEWTREWTSRVALPGGDLPHGDFAAFLDEVRQRWPFLSPALAQRLARAYGTRITKVLAHAKRMDDLGIHFGAGLTQAEIEYLRAHEWALTAEDVLWRRTKRGLHMSAAERESVQRYLDPAGQPNRALVP